MILNKNNNHFVVRKLASRSVRSGGRTSLLTALTIALTAFLVTAMVLQITGLISSEKKLLERVQQVIYMNLTKEQRSTIEEDERISSTVAYKTGKGVEEKGILILPSYYETATADMDSSLILSEGRLAETVEEVVVDKATLRALGLPETLGTRITIPFLNGVPETFTVVGLTDHEAGGGTISRHLLYLSLAYAENGTQLAEEPWYLLARVIGGADMNGSVLERLVYQLGEEHGVAYQNVNPNNSYVDLRKINITNLLVYIAISVALAVVSLIVIYSIFYLSVAGRVRQFGQLRTIGMTPKQLRRMVKLEGWQLWGLGTPAGFVAASISMLVVGPENGWRFSNNLLALAASALVCAAAVRLGVQKPASLAADVSPIEAARFQSWKGDKERTDITTRSLTPLGLAKLNFSRNLKRQVLTILSLGVGGILFMTACIYMNAWSLEGYSRQREFQDNEYALYFDYNSENSLENGRSAMQLQGLFGEEFQEKLRQLPEVEAVTPYKGVEFTFRWDDIEGNDNFTPIERENANALQQYLQEGTGDYDALVESGGVYVSASGLWKELYGKVPQIGDEIEFSYYNGESCTVRLPVVGIGTNDVYIKYTSSGMILIPQETANKLFGDMDTTKMLAVSMKSNSHTPELDAQMYAFLEDYPQINLITLTGQMENAEDTYNMLKGMLISISGFVILFGLVNLLNTLLSSLIARRQQLAMLAALGMTRRQIQNMLNYENLFLSGVNLVITLILGTLAGWGVCRLMDKIGADYVQFSFPILWFLLYVVIAVGMPKIITHVCLRNFYRESLIERLRIAE